MSKFKPWHVCVRLPRHTAVEGLSCDDVEEEVALYVFFFFGLLHVCWNCHCRNMASTLWQGITLYVRYCLEE